MSPSCRHSSAVSLFWDPRGAFFALKNIIRIEVSSRTFFTSENARRKNSQLLIYFFSLLILSVGIELMNVYVWVVFEDILR